MLNLTIIMSALIYMGDIDFSKLKLETSVNLNNLSEIAKLMENERSTSDDWFGQPLNFLNGAKIGEKYKVIKISINDDIRNIFNFTDTNTNVTLSESLLKSILDDRRSDLKVASPEQVVTPPPPQGIIGRTTDFFKSILQIISSPNNVVQSVFNAFKGNDTISANNNNKEKINSLNDNNGVDKMDDKNDVIINENKLAQDVSGEKNDGSLEKDKEAQVTNDKSNNKEIQDILKTPYDVLSSKNEKIAADTADNKDDKDPATRIIGGSPSLKYTPVRNKFRGDINW